MDVLSGADALQGISAALTARDLRNVVAAVDVEFAKFT
jgi:hypothetical protein